MGNAAEPAGNHMNNEVVITAALRTAVGKFGGSLAKLPAAELGARVIRGLLDATGVKAEQISEVIMGQVLTAGCGQNPARQALINSGIPAAVPAMTVGKVCGSGLKATHLARRICETCNLAFCLACDSVVHHDPSRRQHRRYPLGHVAWALSPSPSVLERLERSVASPLKDVEETASEPSPLRSICQGSRCGTSAR